MEDWQQQRMDFYTNTQALEFINNYFNVKKGKRCIAGHVKDMYLLNKSPTYRLYENNKVRAMTIPDYINNKYNALKDFGCVHSFMYIFNEKVLQPTDPLLKKEIMKDSIEGLNAVIELDSPEEPNNDKAKRTSFFDHVQEFDIVINKIDKILNELGENYNLMFSGNGIYIIIEGYYNDNLQVYINNFINLIDMLKEKEGLGDLLKVHVDNKAAPWNDYFKIPFTFHEKKSRISIPLSKDEPLNKEWIDKVTNIDNEYNILNNNSIIDEIIKKANWSKLW